MIPNDLELLKYFREQETITPIDPIIEKWEEEERMEEPNDRADRLELETA